MQMKTLRLGSMLIGESISDNSTQILEEFKQNGKILLRNKILLSPGNWNGLDFSSEEIKKAFLNTDWSDKYNYALIYDHDEKAINWLGNVLNVRMENDVLLGDLEIFDEDLARKLTIGGAKLGISARVLGKETEDGEFVDFTYNNFSVVYDPACKNAYINLSKDKALEAIAELKQKLVELESGITTAGSVSGKTIGAASVNEKIKYDKKKKKKDKDELSEDEEDEDELSDSHLLKGGNNLSDSTMEKEEEKIEVVEEVKEEAVEEVAEEVAPEADNSDASEELSSKIDLVLKQVKELSEKISKLEEASEAAEAVEEVEEAEEAPAEEEAELEDEKSEDEAEDEAELSENGVRKAMSIVDLSNDRNLKRGYSAGDLEFAQLLSEGARLA